MTNQPKKISTAQKRLYERQERVIREYLQVKKEGGNLTEWKWSIAKKLKVTTHAIDSYIRKNNQSKIVERIISNT